MSIEERLSEDLRRAMRAQDALTKDTVRLMRAAVKNAEIERGGRLDDAGVLEVLTRMAKQYRDSVATYRDHGREDLASREEAELAVLARYLPAQLGEEEVRAAAHRAVAALGASGPQEKGRVMGRLMGELRGRADGSLVNRIVTEILGDGP